MGWDTRHVTEHGCGCFTVTVSHDSFLGSHQERRYCTRCRERLREEHNQWMRKQEEERERKDNTLHQCGKCKREARAIDMGYTTKGSAYKKCVECRGAPRPRTSVRSRFR